MPFITLSYTVDPAPFFCCLFQPDLKLLVRGKRSWNIYSFFFSQTAAKERKIQLVDKLWVRGVDDRPFDKFRFPIIKIAEQKSRWKTKISNSNSSETKEEAEFFWKKYHHHHYHHLTVEEI